MRRYRVVAFACLLSGCLALISPAAAAPPEENALRNLPPFENYQVDPYIAAAGKLRPAGKDKAVEALRAAAQDRWQDSIQVIILCRMLFTAKPGKEFRRPWIGAPVGVGGTGLRSWQLEPIEVVDGVPFLVVWGYNVAGFPEPAEAYLEYCLKECDWGANEFKPRTAEEKNKALKKLLASPKWPAKLADWDRRFLEAQIK